MWFYEINICQVITFKLYTDYNNILNMTVDYTVGSKIIRALEIIRVKKLTIKAVF